MAATWILKIFFWTLPCRDSLAAGDPRRAPSSAATWRTCETSSANRSQERRSGGEIAMTSQSGRREGDGPGRPRRSRRTWWDRSLCFHLDDKFIESTLKFVWKSQSKQSLDGTLGVSFDWICGNFNGRWRLTKID